MFLNREVGETPTSAIAFNRSLRDDKERVKIISTYILISTGSMTVAFMLSEVGGTPTSAIASICHFDKLNDRSLCGGCTCKSHIH